MASGAFFKNVTNPVPVVQVGTPAGMTGVVEWSDMIVSTEGACAGAILIQWNLASPAATPSGMWDVHTRIGGFKGSKLQTTDCPVDDSTVNPNCIAAFQSMRISATGSGLYMENNWLWTADHDLDDVNDMNTQITVYVGRGLSIESTTGIFWLVGTAVEHHVLYQYQLYGTKSIFMGFIQTETPYYQPSPNALVPFAPVADRFDPDFANFCAGKPASCNMAWGVRIVDSTDVLIYGAGLYSFFNNYSTECSDHADGVYNEYCQAQIFGIDEGGPAGATYSGSTVSVLALSTIGSESMLDRNGASVARYDANTGQFASTIARYIV